jgi:galactokinase
MIEARAPGRVNVIGEHTDYNGGFVMPCAIGYETRVSGREGPGRTVVVSTGRDEAAFALDDVSAARTGDWRDYVRGVLSELAAAGVALRGAELRVSGTLPIGAGLSSSASFEAALALALLAIAETAMEKTRLALLLQRAEIAYAGTRCGIMDQFAVLHARGGCALLLDTRDLTFEDVAIPASLAIVICNSMVRHDLAAAGAYNERREECEASVVRLRTRYPEVRELRDLSVEQLLEARDLLPSPLYERCRHVVGENARVIDAAAALRAQDFPRLGALMAASHESLRDDYAVSCAELDALVRLAGEFPGTYGTRMTGGGFGGCTVNIVERRDAQAFSTYIAAAYRRETGIEPEIYDGTPVRGASLVGG